LLELPPYNVVVIPQERERQAKVSVIHNGSHFEFQFVMTVNPISETRHWIDSIVIGLNLCPFASSVFQEGTVQIVECDKKKVNELMQVVLQQFDMLHHVNEKKVSTSLLVFSQALSDFDQYLSFVDAANDLLVEAGLDGDVQIASFHPLYCFDGVDADDVSNYSNRSPYPMLHFLRESHVAKALENYPNSEQIPDNNIKRLRRLGKKNVLELIHKDS
jgi:uncharacterized protein